MALTITNVKSGVMGDMKYRIVTVDFDSSYPTGGEVLTAGDLQLVSVMKVDAQLTSGYGFQYDHANEKLLAYYGDNNNASDGPLIQVPNTTDLSAITGVRLFVLGV